MSEEGDSLRVRVLGPVEVEGRAGGIPLLRPSERALAVRLALAAGAAVPDATLAAELWGEAPANRPAQRLRVLASRLRAALGPAAVALTRTDVGYALAAEPVDLRAAERAVREVAASTPDRMRAAAERGLALWRGDAFADLRSVPFARREGERWDALRLDLEVARLDAMLQLGELAGARPDLDRLARLHPLHEPLIGLLATALFREGRQADALEQLGALRRRLADELGVDPAPDTAALELRILRQDPSLAGPAARPADPPGIPAGDAPGIPAGDPQLPASGTPFVGREAELAALAGHLRSGGVTTLVGPPGAGKTRLAVQAGRRIHDAGRRVIWVDLSPLQGADAVGPALAAALSGNPAGGDAPVNDLAGLAAAAGPALLVIDNAEHLIDQVASLVPDLRRNSPALTVLVTSQRPLVLSGEEIWQVGPLAVDAAAELFCLRSGLAKDERVHAVCAAVDRLALGVELAAGLTRALTLDQLTARIDDRLRLLVGGSRDAGRRHTSLRAALDWSYALLPPAEQAVLRRLSAFAGGCTLEAAEEVVPGSGVEPGDVAPALADLLDRSLVSLTDDETGRRFRLLETVRAYAAERLDEAGEAEPVWARHLQWCRRHVAAHDVQGPDEAGALRAVFAEWPNLLAALDRAPGSDRAADGLRLATALDDAWMFRGLVEQARRHYARLVDAPGVEPRERAIALSNYGFASALAGQPELAIELLERAGTEAEAAADPELLMRVLYHRGVALVEAGRPLAAIEPLSASEAIAERLGRERSVAAIRDVRATALLYAGDVGGAIELHHASNEVDRAGDHLHGLVRGLVNEAGSRLAAGDLDGARACIDESASYAARLEDTAAEANLEQLRGNLAAARGALPSAVAHFHAALARFRAEGADTRLCQLDLADALLRLGDDRAAADELDRVLAASSDHGVPWLVAQPTCASVRIAQGERSAALDVLRLAECEYADRGFAWTRAITRLEWARAQLANTG